MSTIPSSTTLLIYNPTHLKPSSYTASPSITHFIYNPLVKNPNPQLPYCVLSTAVIVLSRTTSGVSH